MFYAHKRAFITGAASGIGRALAKRLAAEGAAVILCDRDKKGLERTLSDIKALQGKGAIHSLDTSDRNAVHALADKLVAQKGGIDIVINCAGVAQSALVEDLTYDDLEWVMQINFFGMVYGTKAFLPHLLQKGEGHIVNISSMYGFIGIPSQSAYNASKFAIRGFTEALRHELRETPIRVSSVHPGGILTNIARAMRLPQTPEAESKREEIVKYFDEHFANTSAEKAADVIVKGMIKNKKRIRIGFDSCMVDWLQRLFPQSYYRVAAALNPQSSAVEILPTKTKITPKS